MPLIKPKAVEKETQIRVRLKESIFQEMSQYCQWAKVDNHSYFIEEAIKIALAKDKEWLEFKKQL